MKIKIGSNQRVKREKWFDLFEANGLVEAYEHRDKILNNNHDYVVLDMVSEWANFDEYTSLDDVGETILLLRKMNAFEYEMFVAVAKEEVHEPIDIARNILNNDIIKDDIIMLNQDDVWETVEIENEEYAIMH